MEKTGKDLPSLKISPDQQPEQYTVIKMKAPGLLWQSIEGMTRGYGAGNGRCALLDELEGITGGGFRLSTRRTYMIKDRKSTRLNSSHT